MCDLREFCMFCCFKIVSKNLLPDTSDEACPGEGPRERVPEASLPLLLLLLPLLLMASSLSGAGGMMGAVLESRRRLRSLPLPPPLLSTLSLRSLVSEAGGGMTGADLESSRSLRSRRMGATWAVGAVGAGAIRAAGGGRLRAEAEEVVDLIPLAESLWLWARMLSRSASSRMTPWRRAAKKWRPRAFLSPFGPVSPLLFFSACDMSHWLAKSLRAFLASSLANLPSSPGPNWRALNWSQKVLKPRSGFISCRPRERRSTVVGCPVTSRDSLKVALARCGVG